MKIIIKNNRIIDISKKAIFVYGGLQLDNYILALQTDDEGNFLEDVPEIIDYDGEIPEDFNNNFYNFSLEKGFYKSEKYPENINDRVIKLESENNALQEEISNLNYTLMMGGII